MPDSDRRKHSLSDEELMRIHKLIDSGVLDRLEVMAEKDRNFEWLGIWLRNTAGWVAGILTAVILGWNAFSDTIKHIVGK